VTIAIDDKVPVAVLKELQDGAPVAVATAELFAGKRVIVFSCPGAFTPKSTVQQVPSFIAHFDEFLALDIDSVICISVNDAFVMNAWSEACGATGKIRMLADGHAEFHTQLGLEMDCTRFTLGIRSHRFSMLVDDGYVKILNVESPGAYDVSDAAVILQQLRATHQSSDGAETGR
jgi:peroxiredoxin